MNTLLLSFMHFRKHKNDHNSENCADIELKHGVVVAASKPQHIPREIKTCSKSLFKSLACKVAGNMGLLKNRFIHCFVTSRQIQLLKKMKHFEWEDGCGIA